VAIIESRLHRRAEAAHGGHEPESAESAP
jgi:hypothetical protein